MLEVFRVRQRFEQAAALIEREFREAIEAVFAAALTEQGRNQDAN
jgi:hypothetical protein